MKVEELARCVSTSLVLVLRAAAAGALADAVDVVDAEAAAEVAVAEAVIAAVEVVADSELVPTELLRVSLAPR